MLTQLEDTPKDTPVRCEGCGGTYDRPNGIVNFGVRDSFYDEHGFNSTGRDFSRNAFGCLLLYLARQHFLYDISKAIPQGSALVEVGCGGGSRYLASHYDILGVEISERALLNLSRTYPSVVQATVAQLPLTDGCVDAVISSFVLEHLGEDIVCQSLSEMARVLRPGGRMLHFLDLDAHGPFSVWAKKYAWYEPVFVQSKGHFGLRALNEWQKLFEKSGLAIAATRLSCKSWVQDLSIWGMISDSPASGVPQQIGRLAENVRRQFNPAADVIVGALNDLLDPLLPDHWATKAIVTLEKRT
jgi:ubiquinone/menaquinone biosynthesis C-methylase UbiE